MSPVLPTSPASPTDLATFTVMIDGNPIGADYTVSQIVVSRETSRIPFASILILDGDASTQDFPASTSDHFIPGREIEIKAGYHSDEETVFKGIITSHTIQADHFRPSALKIECKDKSVKLTAIRRNKIYNDISDSDVFSQILNNYSMEMEVDATDVTHPQIVQAACTDWDFINIRAEANKKTVWSQDGKVFIKAFRSEQSPVQTFSYGSGILELEAGINAENQFTGYTARSWNPASQEVVEIMAGDPGITGAGNLSGSQISDVLGGEAAVIQHGGTVPEGALQSWADNRLILSRLAKTQGKITVRGNSSVKLGDVISLSGVGDRFNGNVVATGIRHEINAGVWLTHLRFGMENRPFTERFRDDILMPHASGINPGVRGLYTGLVTALEGDPEGEHRIRITIPMFTTRNEELWARIVTLDAGDNRGSFFRPEIGDEVLVGFMNDDPDHPVVLGMLNSSAKPAPAQAADANDEKGFITRSGMKLWFNDQDKSIELRTPAGKFIKLDEKNKEIHLEDENGNKFIMNQDGIKIESSGEITIKAGKDVKTEGLNISAKASVSFTAEGSGSAELKSGATTNVKGSLVQIN